MTEQYLQTILRLLKDADIKLDPGLTTREIDIVENEFEFRFPPDLRQLLQLGLPRGRNFVNWRNHSRENLRERLDWPIATILQDVNSDEFWFEEEWGSRPDNMEDASALAERQLRAAPRLIPIYSHRFIPAEPHEVGNPVFSVYGTDTIYYGSDIADYFSREFGSPRPSALTNAPKWIPFWSAVESINNTMNVNWRP